MNSKTYFNELSETIYDVDDLIDRAKVLLQKYDPKVREITISLVEA